MTPQEIHKAADPELLKALSKASIVADAPSNSDETRQQAREIREHITTARKILNDAATPSGTGRRQDRG